MRDVKASNVILGQDALGARPVLLDFGLVKLLDSDGPSLTSSRSMLGTPAAMAPEQMRGHAVDARTDVYALGVLACHMLTGAPPYGASGVVQSYLQVPTAIARGRRRSATSILRSTKSIERARSLRIRPSGSRVRASWSRRCVR